MHAFSICATALGKKQTTSTSYCGLGPARAPFRLPHVPESTYVPNGWRWSPPVQMQRITTFASPPLECTMQQAHVTCIRAGHWISVHTLNSPILYIDKLPPPPSHSTSYNIVSNHYHHHRHSTSCNACIQYICHCSRKKNRPTVQVTVGLTQHQRPSDHHMWQRVRVLNGWR